MPQCLRSTRSLIKIGVGRLVMRHNTFDLSKFVGLNFGAIWMIHGNQAYWTGNQTTDIVNWQTPQDNTFIRLNRDYFLRPPNSTTATNYPRPGSPSLPNILQAHSTLR